MNLCLFFSERVTAEGFVLPQMWTYAFPSTSPFSQSSISVIKYIGFGITPREDACTYGLFGRLHYYSEKNPCESNQESSHVLARGT